MDTKNHSEEPFENHEPEGTSAGREDPGSGVEREEVGEATVSLQNEEDEPMLLGGADLDEDMVPGKFLSEGAKSPPPAYKPKRPTMPPPRRGSVPPPSRRKSSTPPPVPARAKRVSSAPPPVPAGAKRVLSASPPPRPLATGTSSAPPPVPKTARPRMSSSTPPPIPEKARAIGMADWDDDEAPTNAVGKKTVAELTRLQTAAAHRNEDETLSSVQDCVVHESLPPAPARRGSGRKLAPIAVSFGVGAVVTGVVVAAVLAASGPKTGAIKLDIQPSGDLKVVLDGASMLPGDESPIVLSDLEPGEHWIKVTRPKYAPMRVDFSVKAGETASRSVELERVRSGFSLKTEPPGADVFLGDKKLEGTTPLMIDDLEPGEYELTVSKGERYAPRTMTLQVRSGEIVSLPKQTLFEKKVQVTFVTQPPGASAELVTADGVQALGLTPVSAELVPGIEYTVKYSKERFADKEVPVNVTGKGDDVELEPARLALVEPITKARANARRARPRPQPKAVAAPQTANGAGTLSVQTQPWSQVFVNGKYVQNTPLMGYSLPAGQHTVKVTNPDFNVTKTFRVNIQPGQNRVLTDKLIDG